MLYPEQESALNHLHKVRIDMADWDKEKAFNDSAFLEAAWAVVVTHELIIHSVLDTRRIHPSSDFVDYEDAVSFLKEAMLSDCWNYYADHPSGAKFATYTRFNLHKRLNRFLALTRNSKMPYYVPLSINEKWVEDSIKRIQEKASKKPDYNSNSFSPEVQYREGSEYDKSIRATLPVINAQYAMNARQVTELRRSFGEMGEQGEFTVDPFENVPDDIEFSTPFTDTVSDRAAERDAVASLYRLMSKVLTPREITILQLRFGLTPDGESYTFEAISNVFNLTRERIRQIQKKALRRLRGAFRDDVSAVAELSDSFPAAGRYRVQGRVYAISLKSDPKNVLRRHGGSLYDRRHNTDNSLSIKTPYGWNVRVVGDDTFAPFVEEAKYDSEITLSLTVTEVLDDDFNLVKATRPDNAVLSTRKSVITYKRLAWLDQFQQIDDSL